MNKRQKKKQLKKALGILNDIQVIDSDYESEGVLYILVEDDGYSRLKIEEHCGLLGLDKKKFVNACREEQEDNTLDFANAWYLWHEIEGYAIYHGYKKGFSLERWNEEDY